MTASVAPLAIHPHKGKTFRDMPAEQHPYFVLAKDGFFLRRPIALGTALLPATKPNYLTATDYPQGVFDWQAEPIPASIISQAIDFFRKVYDKHSTEAEVLITFNPETKHYRLFVPYQRVTGASVSSLYEPTHIQRGYLVVGTLHSHCHFSAFHSGTDDADANDMDGVHFTIGMLQNEPPEMVAMVAINKQKFHYKDITAIADISNLKAATAPDWWLNYVFSARATNTEKPKGMTTVTQEQWDTFRGLRLATQVQHKPRNVVTFVGRQDQWTDYDEFDYSRAYQGYTPYSRGPAQPTKLLPSNSSFGGFKSHDPKFDRESWNWIVEDYHDTIQWVTDEKHRFMLRPRSLQTGLWLDSIDGDNPKPNVRYVNAQMARKGDPLTPKNEPVDEDETALDLLIGWCLERGIVTEEELDRTTLDEYLSDAFWIDRLNDKVDDLVTALGALGVKTSVTVSYPKKPLNVPGQTAMTDILPTP